MCCQGFLHVFDTLEGAEMYIYHVYSAHFFPIYIWQQHKICIFFRLLHQIFFRAAMFVKLSLWSKGLFANRAVERFVTCFGVISGVKFGFFSFPSPSSGESSGFLVPVGKDESFSSSYIITGCRPGGTSLKAVETAITIFTDELNMTPTLLATLY